MWDRDRCPGLTERELANRLPAAILYKSPQIQTAPPSAGGSAAASAGRGVFVSRPLRKIDHYRSRLGRPCLPGLARSKTARATRIDPRWSKPLLPFSDVGGSSGTRRRAPGARPAVVRLVFTPHGWSDYLHGQSVDKEMVKRINRLLEDTVRDPFSGIGKPEPLHTCCRAAGPGGSTASIVWCTWWKATTSSSCRAGTATRPESSTAAHGTPTPRIGAVQGERRAVVRVVRHSPVAGSPRVRSRGEAWHDPANRSRALR